MRVTEMVTCDFLHCIIVTRFCHALDCQISALFSRGRFFPRKLSSIFQRRHSDQLAKLSRESALITEAEFRSNLCDVFRRIRESITSAMNARADPEILRRHAKDFVKFSIEMTLRHARDFC